MTKLFRFCYLNLYAFLLILVAIFIGMIPLYRISILLLIVQLGLVIFVLYNSGKLFSTWNDKKIKYKILIERNKNEFRPDTFEIFMQAPCGRLLTKIVLKDLNKKDEYKNLLKYKQPLIVSIKNNFVPQKTRIYIKEDFK